MIISITGFMGCGKSSVGRRLSELLCCPFIDLDKAVADAAGRTIAEIFDTEGESKFRQIELKTLQVICHPESPCHPERSEGSPHQILALGGGTVMTPQCAELVRQHTRCIYLRASVDTLTERLSSDVSIRPLLMRSDDIPLRNRIEDLMSARAATYENTADIIIDTDGKSVEQICTEILS